MSSEKEIARSAFLQCDVCLFKAGNIVDMAVILDEPLVSAYDYDGVPAAMSSCLMIVALA